MQRKFHQTGPCAGKQPAPEKPAVFRRPGRGRMLLAGGLALCLTGLWTAGQGLYLEKTAEWRHAFLPGRDVVLSGNRVIVARREGGVEIRDITDPANPLRIGTAETPGLATALAVDGNLLLVADGAAGLQVFDLAVPEQPRRAGHCPLPAIPAGVALRSDLALAASGESGICLISLENPALPRMRGALDTPGFAGAAAIQEEYAYIADGSQGLRIVRISNPDLPAETGFCLLDGPAVDVCVQGGLVLVALSCQGVAVVDVTDPAAPFVRGYVRTAGCAAALALDGTRLWVADGPAGVQTVDITDPDHPVLLTGSGMAEPLDQAAGIGVYGGVAGVAYGASGKIALYRVPAIPFLTIDGLITLNAGGLTGVTLNGAPGIPLATTGEYRATVPAGWSGTVAPARAGYSFSPGQRTYQSLGEAQTGQNFTATALFAPGDVNWDHVADALDASRLAAFLAGDELALTIPEAAHQDSNAVLNAVDLVLLQLKIQ